MKENLNHQEVIPLEDNIGNIKIKTELGCANRCSLTEGCMSMFYHSQTNQCVLHKFLGIYPESHQTDITNASGWSHFEAGEVSNDELVSDCTKLKDGSYSGVYYILPDQSRSVPVYCDMTTDGGGWTVIQRHSGYSVVDFQRNWKEYEKGFGDPYGDYWLGNTLMHVMTFNHQYELRIDLTTKNNNLKYAVYKTFRIGGSSSKYKLTIGQYSGNAENRMAKNNQMKFTTADQDNDENINRNCAVYRNLGPWWHNTCSPSALNREYSGDGYRWGGLDVLKSVM